LGSGRSLNKEAAYRHTWTAKAPVPATGPQSPANAPLRLADAREWKRRVFGGDAQECLKATNHSTNSTREALTIRVRRIARDTDTGNAY
jgi:hypothetical protein